MPSKLCPHFLGNADLARFVEAGCPAVKLAGVFGEAEALLALRPDLLLIGRVVEPIDVLAEADAGQAPEVSARAFLDRQREQYQRNPLIKVWEGPNEPTFGPATDPAGMRRMAWYAAFEAERLRLLHELGLRGVVGNFPTGSPDLPLWTAFLPALDAAERLQGFLGLHEYSSPFMWSLTGRYQTANCGGALVADEGDTGWTTLRYRKVYRQFLALNGLDEVPLLITECGLDRIGAVCPGQSDGAWRDHIGYWNSYDGAQDPIDYWRGPERDAERYYAEQLIWYDRELQKDPFVVAAAVFTVGGTESWRPFEIAGTRVADALIEHIRASRPAAMAARPTLPPREPPPAGEPARVVVPPGTGPARPPAANLLANAGFEEGQAYFADETRERAVPAGWRLAYAGPDEAPEADQAAPYGRPITVLINNRAVTAADRNRIFAGGAYCWKVCGPQPFRVRLWQAVAGLEAGRTYRFAVSLLPDVFISPGVYAGEPLSSEVRLVAEAPGQAADSGWRTGRETPFGQYTRLTLDFTPAGASATFAVEVRCRSRLPLAAWYIDELSVAPA